MLQDNVFWRYQTVLQEQLAHAVLQQTLVLPIMEPKLILILHLPHAQLNQEQELALFLIVAQDIHVLRDLV